MGGTTPSCAPQGKLCGDQIVNFSQLVEKNVIYAAAQELDCLSRDPSSMFFCVEDYFKYGFVLPWLVPN